MPTMPEKLSLSELGGAKHNADNLAPVDRSYQYDADEWNSVAASVCAASRMTPRAHVRLGWPTAASISVLSHESVWKAQSSLAPTVTRSSAGVYVIAWASSVLDERGVSHDMNLGSGFANVFQSSVASWRAAAAYNVDDLVVPTTPNGKLYRVTVTGTSHATTEPTWPTTLTNTVSNGTVTFRCEAAFPNPGVANYTPTSPSSGTVRTFAVPGGALADMLGVNVDVEIYWA